MHTHVLRKACAPSVRARRYTDPLALFIDGHALYLHCARDPRPSLDMADHSDARPGIPPFHRPCTPASRSRCFRAHEGILVLARTRRETVPLRCPTRILLLVPGHASRRGLRALPSRAEAGRIPRGGHRIGQHLPDRSCADHPHLWSRPGDDAADMRIRASADAPRSRSPPEAPEGFRIMACSEAPMLPPEGECRQGIRPWERTAGACA